MPKSSREGGSGNGSGGDGMAGTSESPASNRNPEMRRHVPPFRFGLVQPHHFREGRRVMAKRSRKEKSGTTGEPQPTPSSSQSTSTESSTAEASVAPEEEEIAMEFVITPQSFEKMLKDRARNAKRRAEEKRQEDFRRINERNSKTGFHPLDHFPKEVWIEILKGLSPKDIANTCEVHLLFRNLIGTDMIGNVLFPLILDHQNKFVEKVFEKAQINKELMELRGVNKTIRTAVDQWLNEDFISAVRNKSVVQWRKNFEIKQINFVMGYNMIELGRIGNIQKSERVGARVVVITLKSQSALGNPRILRYMDYFNVFKQNVTTALGKIGDQIQHLVIIGKEIEEMYMGHGISITRIFELFIEWISLTPNVRRIVIDLSGELLAYGRRIVKPEDFEPIDVSALLPFPKLEYLERVDFDVSSLHCDFYPLCVPILSANSHIETFSFREDLHPTKEQTRGWDVLFKRIQIQSKSIPQLKMMELSFDAKGSSISEIIKSLNNFPTLETLNLTVETVDISKGMCYMELPNLCNFKLDFVPKMMNGYNQSANFFFSLQFLIHVENLKSLKWKNSLHNSTEFYEAIEEYERAKQSRRIIDFGGGYKDLSGSNIWDVFRSLQFLQVGFSARIGPLIAPMWTDDYLIKYERRERIYFRKRLKIAVGTHVRLHRMEIHL